MKSQMKYVPWDILILLYLIPIVSANMLLMALISRIGLGNLAICSATGLAVWGSVLLFQAKLPGFRAGIFNQAGSRHLSEDSRKRYRQAYALIIPGCLALAVLCVKFAIA